MARPRSSIPQRRPYMTAAARLLAEQGKPLPGSAAKPIPMDIEGANKVNPTALPSSDESSDGDDDLEELIASSAKAKAAKAKTAKAKTAKAKAAKALSAQRPGPQALVGPRSGSLASINAEQLRIASQNSQSSKKTGNVEAVEQTNSIDRQTRSETPPPSSPSSKPTTSNPAPPPSTPLPTLSPSQTLALFTHRLTKLDQLISTYTTCHTSLQSSLTELTELPNISSNSSQVKETQRRIPIIQEILDLATSHSSDILIEQQQLKDQLDYIHASQEGGKKQEREAIVAAQRDLVGMVKEFRGKLFGLLKEVSAEGVRKAAEEVASGRAHGKK